MRYPYLLYSPNTVPEPILKLEGQPFALDLSVANKQLLQIDIKNQVASVQGLNIVVIRIELGNP